MSNEQTHYVNSRTHILTFLAITLFYFFETAQMSYFNVLAPYFLQHGIYHQNQIAGLSAAYYYGDMVGLLPVGYALDRFPLRKILLWAIIGSVISAFLLLISKNFTLGWIARFLCGFFGGTFSFIGGIRVLANLFPQQFTYFMGLFLSAGMLAALLCQYPLLLTVNHFGIEGAMMSMALFGVLVCIINLLFLHPITKETHTHESHAYKGSIFQMCIEILKNYRNWLDCLMIVFLDVPISIIGTLWGLVILMNFYHFSDVTSAWIIMSLFAGLTIGLPLWGKVADHYQHPAWIIVIGAGISFITTLLMLLNPHSSALFIAILFFGLGFFSSCQTLGFTWLTKNMRPQLIGLNSAFNSMLFMGTNGGFKQIAAILIASTPLLHGSHAVGNLFVFTAAAMFLAALYAYVRHLIFNVKSNSSQANLALNPTENT